MEEDGDNSYRSDDSESGNESDESDEALPLVRHHSYLPGALHPLYTGFENDVVHEKFPTPSFVNSSNVHPSWVHELAVLELPDVILFPGATLPIRLTDSEWIQHFSRQIDLIQKSGNALRLGVLCLTTQAPSHRSSWARRAYGPARLRRLSERLLAELGDDLDFENETMESLRDRVTSTRQLSERVLVDLSDSTDITTEQPAEWLESRGQASQQQAIRNSISRAEEERRRQEERQRQRSSSYIGRIGTIATVLFTHGDHEVRPSPGLRTQSLVVTALGSTRFRIVGFRSRDEEQDYSNNLRRPGGVRQFLVDELVDAPLALPLLEHIKLGPCKRTGKYNEQTLRRLSIVSPIPIHSLRMVWPWRQVAAIRETMKTKPELSGLEHGLPPLKCDAITVDDDSSAQPTLQGSSSYDRRAQCLLEPVAFSFWMAANLPLQQEERLQLLEMNSTVERLRFIQSKITGEPAEAIIHCRNCLTPISRARQMFTVGGAEGTTGNYVNEHGIVHQTITLRQIDENEVWYQGGPETQDSWFPGYSWTIMACDICGHHLGWRFQRVVPVRTRSCRLTSTRARTTTTETADRPEKFYGVTTANVSTFIPSTRERRQENSRAMN